MEVSSQAGFRTRSHVLFFFSDKIGHHISGVYEIEGPGSMESLSPNDIHIRKGANTMEVTL
jgi:hypothetical protein